MDGRDQESRFIADRMLGRLARYLRLLGYDTSYPPPGPDARLVAKAQAEGRILLTRDRGIFLREGPRNESPRVVEIESQEVLGQLEQLAAEGLIGKIGDPRCSVCNQVLVELAETEARHLMPPFTSATHCVFLYCRSCNMVLWEGSHWERFRGRVYHVLYGAHAEGLD
jgi:uncharacterized protein with PIN domain